MKIIRPFYTTLLLLFLLSCSGIQVSQDYDQGYNFSELKTFSWKPNKDNEYGYSENPLVDKRIRVAIAKTFSEKQFTQVDTGSPDFLISYHVTVKQKISTSNVSGGVSYGRYGRGRYGSVGISSGTQVRAYDQGTLLIDVTETAGNTLIWRGISTQTVSEHSNPEESTKLINKTVEKVLEQFPPRQEKLN